MVTSRPDTRSTELDAVQDFLVWARSENFSVHRVIAGAVTVEVTDLRVGLTEGQKEKTRPDFRTTDEKWADELGMSRPGGSE